MSGRFPDVDWFCDRCNARLNTQAGFDDNKYTWKCAECGHKNSISRDNIHASKEDFLALGTSEEAPSGGGFLGRFLRRNP